MIRYVPVKELLYSDELGSYTAFGIRVLDHSNKTIALVSDISTDHLFVSDLCDRFTLHQLSFIHLFDALDDSF